MEVSSETSVDIVDGLVTTVTATVEYGYVIKSEMGFSSSPVRLRRSWMR